MEGKEEYEGGWIGFPESTEEQIEEEVVTLIVELIEWKKSYYKPCAPWRVGTTKDVRTIFEALTEEQVAIGISSWHAGSPMRAAREIGEYHGMELEGASHETDTHIYAYTDRPPTILERKSREKDPLTRKQKTVFRAIKTYCEHKGQGPTKTQVRKILSHRSITTTNDFLHILQRKNWIIISEGRQSIELI